MISTPTVAEDNSELTGHTGQTVRAEEEEET
jgi:hypothetical protein